MTLYYSVEKNDNDKDGNEAWLVHVTGGANTRPVAVITAKSEKQAHFLAQQAYPKALSPAKLDAKMDAYFNSKEGQLWRAKHGK